MDKYNKIKENFELIIKTAREYKELGESYDNEEESGERTNILDVKYFADDNYFEKRKSLEEQLASLMYELRKIVDDIPAKFKKEKPKNDLEEIDNEYDMYRNHNFKTCMKFFGEIEGKIERDLVDIKIDFPDDSFINELIQLRYSFLSFLNIADLLNPEVTSIEKEVELIFKLRELNMEVSAEQLEGITEIDDLKTKCLNVRTALEQVVVSLLRTNEIPSRQKFFGNLDLCINNELIEKNLKKPIAITYSYASKIIHGDIDCSEHNVRYAISGIYNTIEKIISNLSNTSE